MSKLSFLIFIFFIMQFAAASILPENNLTIPLSEKKEGLTEAQYLSVINKVEAIYKPIIEGKGFKLTINRLWSDPRVNAGTTKKGKEWILNMYGGYARHSSVTEDGYTLVMCHELGHHLGETPKKIFSTGEDGWPSVEGQADYFATLKCLRTIFNNDENETIIAGLEVPFLVKEKCTQAFKESWETAICIRSSLAGLAVSAISADIRNTDLPSVETPDPAVVKKTFEAHPIPQCRLDTYFQGSLCTASHSNPLSKEDESKGTCHSSLGHLEGLRPLCWFRPRK